jgi:hypothetical protein
VYKPRPGAPAPGRFKEKFKMPMQVTEGQPIPNHFQPNQNQKTAAHEVIAHLQYADLWRGAGTLHNTQLVRVDMQGTIAGDPVRHNIQVQVNGIGGHSTIAHADVLRGGHAVKEPLQHSIVRGLASYALNGPRLDTAKDAGGPVWASETSAVHPIDGVTAAIEQAKVGTAPAATAPAVVTVETAQQFGEFVTTDQHLARGRTLLCVWVVPKNLA